jgi:esterase/lipase
MSRKFIFISFPILLLIGIYFIGPAPAKPVFSPVMPIVPQTAGELENYVAQNESKHKLKPDNEARIVWADSTKAKTKYSVIYLHGFSASQEEGDPVHENFAKKFGCNLYLARLADHGIDTVDQLINFTPDRWWESSKQALAIGKALGEKVIIMSTSTGGTTALMLAAQFPEDVFALINMSPNIAINDPNAWIANNPWGLQMARLIIGGKSRVAGKDPEVGKYWNNEYRLESISQLEELLEDAMTKETFSKVHCPSLSLYFYKNEQEQDPTVKVSAILEMNKQLGTPDAMKEAIAIPEAGGHVLASRLVSKDIPAVEEAAEKFAIEKLDLKKVTNEYEFVDNDFAERPFGMNLTRKNINQIYSNRLVAKEKFKENKTYQRIDTIYSFGYERDSIDFLKTNETEFLYGAVIKNHSTKLNKGIRVGMEKSKFIKIFNIPKEFQSLNEFRITTFTGYCQNIFQFKSNRLQVIYLNGCWD